MTKHTLKVTSKHWLFDVSLSRESKRYFNVKSRPVYFVIIISFVVSFLIKLHWKIIIWKRCSITISLSLSLSLSVCVTFLLCLCHLILFRVWKQDVYLQIVRMFVYFSQCMRKCQLMSSVILGWVGDIFILLYNFVTEWMKKRYRDTAEIDQLHFR